jgi:hypothetical protein
MQNLRGGTALDQRVLDKVHLPEATLAEQPDHIVITDTLASLQCHAIYRTKLLRISKYIEPLLS